MCSAAVAPLRPAESSQPRHTSAGVVGYPHRLGRIMLQPGGPNPVQLHVGRSVVAMTAEEANSMAMALAKAAADSGRVL